MESANLFKELTSNLDFMNEQLTNIEEISLRISAKVEALNRRVPFRNLDLRNQISISFGSLEDLNKEIQQVKSQVMLLVPRMKNTLKEAELERFNKRIQVWAPELFIRDKELERLL